MTRSLTIATFNAENLFTRYRFRGKKRRVKNRGGKSKTRTHNFKGQAIADVMKGGVEIEHDRFKRVLPATRALTAKTIAALKADILVLQEVENLDTLKLFNDTFLAERDRFKFQYTIDGNDPRFIDVAILSNVEVDFLRTHQFRHRGRDRQDRIFSRDCLEAHFDIGGRDLMLLCNHFKSIADDRAKTRRRRLEQSREVIKILTERYGPDFGRGDFVVLGDLNDFLREGEEASCGLTPLLTSPEMENVVSRLEPSERWTHYYRGDRSYNQLDYILVSRALAERNPTAKPVIERRGLPLRVNRPGQAKRVKRFFPEVKGRLKASDHCPVAITLEI